MTGETTRLSADYSYGTEIGLPLERVQRQRRVRISSRRTRRSISRTRAAFDKVCTAAYTPSTAPSARTRLDSSEGCFTDDPLRAARDADITTLQAAWTQAWTPVLAMQLVLTGSIQHGFLENPYRGVVIAAAGQDALENHPDNRAARCGRAPRKVLPEAAQRQRSAPALRMYRDTWDIFGQTYEVEGEKYLTPALRAARSRALLHANGRALLQRRLHGRRTAERSAAASTGPGTASSRRSRAFLFGGRVLYATKGGPQSRILGFLLGFRRARASTS